MSGDIVGNLIGSFVQSLDKDSDAFRQKKAVWQKRIEERNEIIRQIDLSSSDALSRISEMAKKGVSPWDLLVGRHGGHIESCGEDHPENNSKGICLNVLYGDWIVLSVITDSNLPYLDLDGDLVSATTGHYGAYLTTGLKMDPFNQQNRHAALRGATSGLLHTHLANRSITEGFEAALNNWTSSVSSFARRMIMNRHEPQWLQELMGQEGLGRGVDGLIAELRKSRNLFAERVRLKKKRVDFSNRMAPQVLRLFQEVLGSIASSPSVSDEIKALLWSADQLEYRIDSLTEGEHFHLCLKKDSRGSDTDDQIFLFHIMNTPNDVEEEDFYLLARYLPQAAYRVGPFSKEITVDDIEIEGDSHDLWQLKGSRDEELRDQISKLLAKILAFRMEFKHD